ncbi:MAG: hypothetical protein G01um101425_561 [Candidatus Peregrinibacteria bacterium Gr01-1014_25]|nr:MAG: hypothetical protein G01um101425_561 [Candidatus Peregrinibacteria bacterium Gr01-1014_25]
MSLTSEQPNSAHDALRDAEIRHGDTQEVKIAVGTMPSFGGAKSGSHVAFCSATIRAGKVLKRGSILNHLKRIGGDIVFTNADEVAQKLGGRNGVALMSGTVFTNGHVELTIDPESVRVVPVTQQEESHLRSSTGRGITRRILELETAKA